MGPVPFQDSDKKRGLSVCVCHNKQKNRVPKNEPVGRTSIPWRKQESANQWCLFSTSFESKSKSKPRIHEKRIDRVHPCSCLGRPNVGPLVKQTLSQAWRGPPKVFLLSEWTKIKNTSLFERKDIVVSPKEHTFWRQNNFKTKKIKKLEWHFASLKSH